MIPVKLTLKGIYSYQEEQVIVFDKLAQEGLFGIFGPVGSGKSTIIEAISFALYGETQRLNKAEHRAQNMMNLKAKEMIIRFECLAGPRNDMPYLFSVKHYTTGKKNEIIRTERGIYKWDNNNWQPTYEKPEQIVGLSYDNFQRTIIIPQGKFSEFLHLGGAERTNALMEIFQLGKYDLDDKAKRIQDKAATELKAVEVQLNGLEEITAESLEAVQLRLTALVEAEKEETAAYNTALLTEKEWEEIKGISSAISHLQNEHGQLKARETEYAQKEQELQQFENCQRLFKDLIDNREKLEQEYNRYVNEQARLEEALKEKGKEKEIVNNNFIELKERYDKRDKNIEALRSIRKLSELKKIEKDLIRSAAEKEDHSKRLAICEEGIAESDLIIKTLSAELDTIKGLKPDIETIANVQQWFADKKVLQGQLGSYEKQYLDVQKRLDEPYKQLHLKLQTSPTGISLLLGDGEDIITLSPKIEELLAGLDNDKTKAERDWEAWQVEKTLLHYANLLEPGKPCPLCGATEHPNTDSIAVLDNDKENSLISARKSIQAKTDWLKKIQAEIQHFDERKQEEGKQLEDIKTQILTIREAIKEHGKGWLWQAPYDSENESSLAEVKNTLSGLVAKENKWDQQIKQARLQLEDRQKGRQLAEKTLQQINNDASIARERIAILKQEIIESDIIKYAEHSPERLAEVAELWEQKIKKNEEDYNAANSRLQSLNLEISKLEGTVHSNKQILLESQLKKQKADETLAQRLKESGFANQNLVEQILKKDIDIAASREDIRQYRSSMDGIATQLIQWEEKRKGRDYMAEEHALLQTKLLAQKAVLDNLKEETGRQKQAREEQQKQWDKKQKLGLELSYWQVRHENLQSIRNLFRSRGFVDYVSSVYLHSLCQAANERFSKLSRQSLSLEMTDKNEFQVRDYLNEGKTRHIKTLSGGQTFQAALSLALALADNTQKLASRKQNFFFMDEGFGSLDKESLRTVMDTLKTLRKENRIVGIISHVEELQQEIDVYLSISNSDTRGSLVQYSWEKAS